MMDSRESSRLSPGRARFNERESKGGQIYRNEMKLKRFLISRELNRCAN